MIKFILLILSPLAWAEPKILNGYVGVPFDISIPQSAAIRADRLMPRIARLQISADGKKLRVNPFLVGTETIALREVKSGKIVAQYILHVAYAGTKIVAQEVSELLRDIDGISVTIADGRVVIDGQVPTAMEISRIHSVVKMYGERVRSLVTITPSTYERLAKIIEKEIGNPEIKVRIINGFIILEGVANSPAEAARAETIAALYTPNIVVDDAVADKKIIKVNPL